MKNKFLIIKNYPKAEILSFLNIKDKLKLCLINQQWREISEFSTMDWISFKQLFKLFMEIDYIYNLTYITNQDLAQSFKTKYIKINLESTKSSSLLYLDYITQVYEDLSIDKIYRYFKFINLKNYFDTNRNKLYYCFDNSISIISHVKRISLTYIRNEKKNLLNDKEREILIQNLTINENCFSLNFYDDFLSKDYKIEELQVNLNNVFSEELVNIKFPLIFKTNQSSLKLCNIHFNTENILAYSQVLNKVLENTNITIKLSIEYNNLLSLDINNFLYYSKIKIIYIIVRQDQEEAIDLSLFINLEELIINTISLKQVNLINFQDCKRLKRVKLLIKNIFTDDNFEDLINNIKSKDELTYFEIICYSSNSLIFEIENVFFINLSYNYINQIKQLIRSICLKCLENNNNSKINVKSTYSLFKYFYEICPLNSKNVIDNNIHSLYLLSNNEGSIQEQYNFSKLYSLNIQFIKNSHDDISDVFLSNLNNITLLTITFTSVEDSLNILLYLSKFNKMQGVILNFKFFDINFITDVMRTLTLNSLTVLRKLHLFTINILLTYSFSKELFDKKLILLLRENLVSCYKTNIDQVFGL